MPERKFLHTTTIPLGKGAFTQLHAQNASRKAFLRCHIYNYITAELPPCIAAQTFTVKPQRLLQYILQSRHSQIEK